jgi:hypothetical protein
MHRHKRLNITHQQFLKEVKLIVYIKAIILLLLITITSCSRSNIEVKILAWPSLGYPPLEVLLDASASYNKFRKMPLQFVWELADGSTFEEPILLKGFEEPGDHVVRLKVSDGVETVVREVTVHVQPIPEKNIRRYQLTSDPTKITIENALQVTVSSGPPERVLTAVHLPISTQPVLSPFRIIDAWTVTVNVPKDVSHATQNFIISFNVPAEVSDPTIIEWMGDFWALAENGSGLPGGTFDPFHRTISVGRTRLSTFALAKLLDPVLKALDKVPDIPPKPIFNHDVKGLPNDEIAVDITMTSPNLVSYNIRDFNLGFGGMWYCIDFRGDGKVTWDQPPAWVDSPLLQPGVKQKARVILPRTGGTFTVCLRPGCSDALKRAAADWVERLGLPLEARPAVAAELVELVWELLEQWGKIKIWNFPDYAKEAIKLAAKEVYSLAIKHLTKRNLYMLVVNALPVAGDMASFILGTLKSKWGFEPDPCWTVTIPSSPTIVTETLPSGNIGKGYEAMLEVEGGNPPYIWSIMAGNLPPGLTLEKESGRISGVPTTEGTWRFVIKVVDKNGLSGQKNFEMIIGEMPPPPSDIEGEYILFGKTEGGETVLKLDKDGKFKIISSNDYTTVVLSQGIYKKISEEYLLFDLVPEVIQVKAQVLPNANAIIGSLTFLTLGEVWVRRGLPIPELADIIGNYKKLGDEKYLTIQLDKNLVLLTISVGHQRCSYIYEYVPDERNLYIRGLATQTRECDILLTSSISWFFVIDNEYIYTYSLLDEKWTGLWEKIK